MASRKLIRPDADLTREVGQRTVRKKQNPPEQTNAEEYYYLKQMAAKTSMVVVLNNDEEVVGTMEWYDRGAIKINRKRGPNLVIPKHSIRYLFKEEERKRAARRPRRSAAGSDS